MMFRLWVSSLATACLLCAQQPPPLIRTEVTLVHVPATVRNQTGELVGTLTKDDFTISDNGVAQEIAFLQHTTEMPLSIALLLDTSGSTSKELKYELDCASRFLRALLSDGNAEDSVGLYDFSYDVSAHSFTHNFSNLDRYLKDLDRLTRSPHPELGTSLWDAVYFASRDAGVAARPQGDHRGDGWRRHHQPAGCASGAQGRAGHGYDAVVYPVVVMPITSDSGRNTGGENALTVMAQGTGGRSFLPSSGPQLDKTFNDIITELRTQYVLDFYPRRVPLTKDPFHKLEVHVKRPELRVSARNGYYGEAEGSSSDARVTVTPERPAPPAVKKKDR